MQYTHKTKDKTKLSTNYTTHLVLSVLCYLWQSIITVHSATFGIKTDTKVFYETTKCPAAKSFTFNYHL